MSVLATGSADHIYVRRKGPESNVLVHACANPTAAKRGTYTLGLAAWEHF